MMGTSTVAGRGSAPTWSCSGPGRPLPGPCSRRTGQDDAWADGLQGARPNAGHGLQRIHRGEGPRRHDATGQRGPNPAKAGELGRGRTIDVDRDAQRGQVFGRHAVDHPIASQMIPGSQPTVRRGQHRRCIAARDAPLHRDRVCARLRGAGTGTPRRPVRHPPHGEAEGERHSAAPLHPGSPPLPGTGFARAGPSASPKPSCRTASARSPSASATTTEILIVEVDTI